MRMPSLFPQLGNESKRHFPPSFPCEEALAAISHYWLSLEREEEEGEKTSEMGMGSLPL